MRRVTLHVATAAALAAAPLLVPAAAHATTGGLTGLMANFSISQTWSSGFQGNYAVTNNSNQTVNSWSLTFTLPTGEAVTSAWNGTLSHSGSTYTITSPSWASALAPGASADVVGLDISSGTTQTAPQSCTINNLPCQGEPADTTPPTAPTGLAVTVTGPGSIALSWTASTDNVGVTGYDIDEGGSVVATSTGTRANITGLLGGSSHTFTVTAFDEAGNVSAPSAAVTAVAGSGTAPGVAAPYVDMGAYPTPSLPGIVAASGLKQLSLAFIVNGSTPCTASWFGDYNTSTGWDAADIAAVKAAGGDVRVSFGGENGTELAQSCTDVPSLTAQYQQVVNEYGLDWIDFDIEGSAVTDHASIDRRSAAIAAVQAAQRAKGRNLQVSFTLPVLPSGLTSDGLYVLQSAAAAGVTVSDVNVMAMDFGDSTAPNPSGQMGTYAIDSAEATEAQVKSVWPSLTDAQAYAMVGVTPMIGQNDSSDEVFGLSDASQLITFAEQKHLASLGFWEVGRDANACTGSLSDCTDVAQTPYEFSKLFAGYTG